MPELTENVRRLLVDLGSIEALESVLLLARTEGRWWSAGQLASTLHTGPLEPTLEKLAQLKLLDVRLGNDVLYKFAPTSPALAETVRQLVREYEEHRLMVLELLVVETLDPRSPIRAFAEALRVRRKKDV